MCDCRRVSENAIDSIGSASGSERCASAGADDARLLAARSLVPLARVIRDQAKGQADRISRTERRFGAAEIMHLARLLDDVWMAADSFIADLAGSSGTTTD
jgi:hypothetical protein